MTDKDEKGSEPPAKDDEAKKDDEVRFILCIFGFVREI